MTGASLPTSRECVIEIEPGNPFFPMKDGFLMDSNETIVVRYFGDGCEVTIPENISVIGDSCFTDCDSIAGVDFGPISAISLIDARAFQRCHGLKSITIPSSVVQLAKYSFFVCESLACLAFEPNSQLKSIGKNAFGDCTLLKSIDIPSSVERLGRICFSCCEALTAVNFASDSKLVEITAAFLECVSLKSFVVPSVVEIIDESSFENCVSLTELIFAPPSHVRQLLSLPPVWPGWHEIPDSVEELAIWIDRDTPSSYRLTFGPESKLKRLRPMRWRVLGRSFLQVSSRSLKSLRLNLEFDEDVPGWK
jgi:hypothetical protein